MKRIYDTGLENNTITLEVNVGTVGVAYTAAYLSRAGGQYNKIRESNADSGNISSTPPIGQANTLRKAYVIIRTLINLSHLSDKERESAINYLFIEYKFSGGFSGNQTYNYDIDDITISPDKKLVSVTKPIEMI